MEISLESVFLSNPIFNVVKWLHSLFCLIMELYIFALLRNCISTSVLILNTFTVAINQNNHVYFHPWIVA